VAELSHHVKEKRGSMIRKMAKWYIITIGLLAHLFVLFIIYLHITEARSDRSEPSSITLYEKFPDSMPPNERIDRLMFLTNSGYSIKAESFVEKIGTPDCWIGNKDTGNLTMAYYYDRFGKRDWIVYASFEGHYLKDLGWNASSVSDRASWAPWSAGKSPIEPQQVTPSR
jgi:hypothetical protein